MKKIIAVCVVLALMVSATGCVGVNFSSYGGRGGSVQGSGLISVLNFSTDKLNSLTIKIPAELYYTVGDIDGRIELYANLMQHVTVSEKNGNVVIDSDIDINVNNNGNVPKIYVSAPSLEALSVDSAVNVKEMDTITADSFLLDIDGVFNGAIDLAVKNLNVDLAGVGNVELTGTADNSVIEMSGLGNLQAFGLQTKVMDIETSGMGNAEVNCSEKLIAKISGMGGIQYKGSPSVEPDISGMGGLKKAD